MGQRTKFMELPTQLIMNAMSGERRWKRIALFSILGTLVAGGVGAAAMYALGSNNLVALHKDWAETQGCLLGGPLGQGETPGTRARLLQMASVGQDPATRPMDNGKAWPASCASQVDGVAQMGIYAEGGSAELVAAAGALVKALAQNGAADLRKPVDDLWTAAQAAGLKDVPSAPGFTTPKPPQLAFASLTPLPKFLGAEGLALTTLRVEPNSSTVVRLLVDDKGVPSGPVVCSSTESAAMTCARISADAIAQSPKLRLLGGSEPSATTFVFGGDRGAGGIFRGAGKALATGATTYGAYADETGKGWLLVRRGNAQDLSIAQQPAAGGDLTDVGSFSHTQIDNLNDATLAFGWLVYRSPAVGTAQSHLFARPLSDANAAPIDVGAIAEGPAAAADQARFSACKSGGTLAVRVKAARSDFVAMNVGGKWSAPVAVPDAARGGALSCREGEAWTVRVSHGDGSDRDRATVDAVKCTPTACTPDAHVQLADMVHGSVMGLPQDKESTAAAVVDGKLLVVWNAGTSGGLRARFASPDKFGATEDILLADDVDATTGQSAVLDLTALAAGRAGVVLVRMGSGVRALHVDSGGRFEAMTSVFQ